VLRGDRALGASSLDPEARGDGGLPGSPHAFMLEAIARETTRAEQYDAFLDDARTAEAEVERTGLHYAAEDVFRYMTARAAGKRARRPKPKS
jgi:hypothetical protein